MKRIEPFRSGANVFKIGGGDSGAAEKIVDGVEKTPETLRIDRDIAIEFSRSGECISFPAGNQVFEPIPTSGLIRTKNEPRFAIRVLTIPLRVAEGFVDAMPVKAAHQRLNAHSGLGGVGRRPRPGGKPAAIEKAAENSELGDNTGPEIETGTGQDLGENGVIDVDIEGGFLSHVDSRRNSKARPKPGFMGCEGFDLDPSRKRRNADRI